jgi:hypothetical protein
VASQFIRGEKPEARPPTFPGVEPPVGSTSCNVADFLNTASKASLMRDSAPVTVLYELECGLSNGDIPFNVKLFVFFNMDFFGLPPRTG